MSSVRLFLLPDPSPFVTKADVRLKMGGLPCRTERGGFAKVPKGKVPYIEDGGSLIGDSTFIRYHIERSYGVDLDRALTGEQGRAPRRSSGCSRTISRGRWFMGAG
ncbi:MAG TPA: glutathione S-transferase N-terminal domain-containing protein [Stellaceae bacterium]|nr:glutathione S-transferase N-terminal domain-containing protein [Stellaceae bacterium]